MRRPTPTVDHDALLARARAGDPEACTAIVVAHQGRVFAQLRGMLVPVGRGAVVEDLAQETFLRGLRALDRFEGSAANLRNWLLTIATRLALQELRRCAYRPTECLDTVSERWFGPTPTSALVGRAIETAIAELPDVYRAAFVLREVQGLDYREIADMLDIDLGTVKSRLCRARARLREALGGSLGPDGDLEYEERGEG